MKNLKVRRLAIGLTQAEFARRCGCSNAYISGIENGKVKPSKKMLVLITKVLDGNTRGVIYPKKRHRKFLSFKDEDEKEELHRIWCERYGGVFDKKKMGGKFDD